MDDNIRVSIRNWSQTRLLDPDFVAAIIAHESSFNRYAMKFEPNWHYFLQPMEKFAKPLGVDNVTEQTLQACSYGLMQIMGSVAREYSYIGPLPRLLEVDLGIQFGTQHLARKFQIYKSLPAAAAAYNAGSPNVVNGKFVNQDYVDSVMDFYGKKLFTCATSI